MIAIEHCNTSPNLLTWRGCTVALFPRRAEFHVYLIHFKTPYKHARHYLGSSMCIEARLLAHEQGRSQARLMEVIHEASIDWELSRLWPCESYEEMRELERHFKRRHNSPQICPTCNPHLAPDSLVMLRAGHYPFHLFGQGKRRPLKGASPCSRFH